MTDVSPSGPEVPAGETLLRAITRPEWWDADGQHLSSAAFGWPKVSVSIQSKLNGDDELLSRFDPGTGLASFNCGQARELGFHAHHEPDENGHDDHAHLYSHNMSSGQRKKNARKLIEASTIVRIPDNERLRSSQNR